MAYWWGFIFGFDQVGCYELSCSCITHFCDRMDTLFHRVLLLQNRLSGNPLGIVEPLLLSSISSLELTPVMGFKGEFSKPWISTLVLPLWLYSNILQLDSFVKVSLYFWKWICSTIHCYNEIHYFGIQE